MKCPTIKAAKAINDHTLLIEFANNKLKRYDITPLLSKEMFAPLKNLTFFKNVRVDAGGYALVWNEDIDISKYELWNQGVPARRAECKNGVREH